MSFRSKWVSLVTCAALFSGAHAFAQAAAQPAPAAEPAPPPKGEVEEIIVTATKREANIQDVPIAVSAFQSDDLTARHIDEVEDLAQISPSINVNTSNTASQGGTLRIRGVGTTGNNVGLEAAVGTFIDGVYRSRSGQGFSDLLDIERIEVLRGPQGTLFGKNTSSGALNVVTKKPVLSEHEGYGLIEYGSFDHKRVAISYSAPIRDEVLGFRVSGQWTDRDGYYNDVNDSDAKYGKRDRYALRGQLLWVPTDSLDFRLIGDYGQREESCCPAVWVRGGGTVGRVLTAAQARGLGKDVPTVRGPNVSIANKNHWTTGVNTAPFEDITDWGISLEGNWDLDWTKLTSLTAYRRFRAHYAEDIDFTSADVLRPQNPNGHGAHDYFFNWSEELRAAGTAFEKLDYLLGFYGYTEKVQTFTRVEWGQDASFVIFANLGTLPPGDGYTRDAEIKTGGWAIFTNDTYHLFDSFDLTVGARYSKETKDAHSFVNGAPIGTFSDPASCANIVALPVPGPLPVATLVPSFCHNLSWEGSREETEWTYTFSAAYHITDDINVYASYSRGYKAGGFNTDQDSFDCIGPVALPADCTGGTLANNTEFEPEFAKSWELGIKGTYLDGRARVNVALFTSTFDDFQLNTFTGLGFIVSNAKDARSRGVELESFFTPVEGLTATLGITYADARYGKDVGISFNLVNPYATPQNGLPCTCFIDHHRLTNAPAWTGTASLNYEHTLVGSEWVGFMNVSSAYRGRHNTGSNLHPYKAEGANWYLNLTAGVRSPDGHWEGSLWANNVTDTYERAVVFDTPTQSGTFHAYVNPPRMWGGTVKYNF